LQRTCSPVFASDPALATSRELASPESQLDAALDRVEIASPAGPSTRVNRYSTVTRQCRSRYQLRPVCPSASGRGSQRASSTQGTSRWSANTGSAVPRESASSLP
jgi:hypothetical protein